MERFCVARAAGREGELPVVEPRRAVPVVEAVAAVLLGGEGKVLFARRREGGLFGGLWEPPMIEGVGAVSPARRLFSELGLPLGRAPLREVGRVTHVLTHRRMVVTVAVGDLSGRSDPAAGAPATLGEPYEKAAWLDALHGGVGVSTLARKVIEVALRGENG